jgi:GTPase SAR1 family protein
LVLGEKATGKTSLLTFLCEGRHEPMTKRTVGMDVQTRAEPMLDFFELAGSCL